MSIIGSVISEPETQKPRQRYSVFFCFLFFVVVFFFIQLRYAPAKLWPFFRGKDRGESISR